MNVDCVLVLRLFLVTKTRDLSGCGHQVSFYSDSSRSKCAFKFCLFCYCKILYGDWVGMCEWLLIVLISLESYLCIHIPSFCIAFVFFSIVPSTARCWCMAVAYRNVDNTHAMASAYGIAFACVFFFLCVCDRLNRLKTLQGRSSTVIVCLDGYLCNMLSFKINRRSSVFSELEILRHDLSGPPTVFVILCARGVS